MATQQHRGTARRDRFFANSALVMLALVLASFSFTYFMPLARGSGDFPLIFHIHAAAFFGWMLLYAWQTQLVATGQVARHREWGLAGIALSTLLVPLGLAMAIAVARRKLAVGHPHPFDTTLFNLTDMSAFAILMTASIAAVTRHSAWHRRLTFGAALVLLGPALSRWLVFVPQAPPWTEMLPNLAALTFLAALAVHDRRTLGHVHRATLCVAALLVPMAVIVPLLLGSAGWRAVAPAIMNLAP